MEMVKNETELLLERMGFKDNIEDIGAHEGVTRRITVRIRGEARMLIGEYGNNLAALEHVLRRIVAKNQGAEAHFTLDINDYRMKRLEDLKQDVKSAAHDARMYKKSVSLRPMSSFERRIVHLLLSEYPDIATESVGDGDERRVVIKPFP
ncbi:MAG: R3H domain-containing nucleic acid-binding protein [Patescibacteria group bacterium]